MYFEALIKKLHKEKDAKIVALSGQGRGILLSIIQRQQNKITLEYNNKIETLERERRFVLEKLPFIKF